MNNLPTVTKNLLIINVLCFFGTIVARRYGIDVENLLGLHFFLASDFNPAQLLPICLCMPTSSIYFLTCLPCGCLAGCLNKFGVLSVFLFYYILCGIGAGLIQEAVQYTEYLVSWSHYDGVDTGMGVIPMAEFLNRLNTVGASGAVYAILLAFGMLFPNSQMFYLPFADAD